MLYLHFEPRLCCKPVTGFKLHPSVSEVIEVVIQNLRLLSSL